MARSPTALSTSAALMAVSSTIGGIIPPSIIMILIASSLNLLTPTMMPGMKPAENRAPTGAGPFGWMLSRLGALNLRTLQGALYVARPGSGLRRRTGGVTTPINRPTETMIAVQIAMTALYELSPLMVSYTLEIIWNMFIVGFGIFSSISAGSRRAIRRASFGNSEIFRRPIRCSSFRSPAFSSRSPRPPSSSRTSSTSGKGI